MQLTILSSLFAAVIIAANLMAVKLVDLAVFTLPAAVFCYPFSFVLNDLITEFHGFRTTRKIVFLTFLLNALVIGFLTLAVLLPPSQFYPHNDAFRVIHLGLPRILAASFAAFITSSLLNSFLFDLLKRTTRLHLILRSASTTFCGVILDSALFITLAFYGDKPTSILPMMIFGHILAKIFFGILIGSPATWLIVRIMRRNTDDTDKMDSHGKNP